jgi:hypothetical protein
MINVYPESVHAVDEVSGEVVPIDSLRNALSVHVEDVHNVLVNKSLHFHTATITTLAAATTGDGTEYQITVASAIGFNVGDFLHIEDGVQEPTHPQIIAIAGNVFDLDRRIDEVHPIGTDVGKAILDLATTIGTLAAPIVYFVQPVPGQIWHITRLLIAMAHSSAGDLGKFGNLASLINGVVIRIRTNGTYRTYTNWKNSGDMKGDMYDIQFDSRSGGGGDFGTSGRWTFAKSGMTIKLDGDTDDQIQVFVQDDLTGLGFLTLKVQGHLNDQ